MPNDESIWTIYIYCEGGECLSSFCLDPNGRQVGMFEWRSANLDRRTMSDRMFLMHAYGSLSTRFGIIANVRKRRYLARNQLDYFNVGYEEVSLYPEI